MSNASLSYTKYYNGSWQNPSGFTGPYVKGYQTGSYLFGVLYTVTINVTNGYKVTGITFTVPKMAAMGSSGSTTLYALLYNSDPQSSFSGATAATPWKTGSASVSLSSTESQKSVSVSNLEITSSGTYYVFLTTNDNNVRNPYINLTLQSSQITCSVTDSKIPTPATSISVSSTLYMGTKTTISWTPYTSGYTYKVSYKFTGQSSETNIVTSTSSSSQTWTPVTTLSANIPNSTSGTVTIYVYSYLNGTQVGSKCSSSLTLNIPSSGRAPTGSSGWYTHGCSKVAGSYVSGYSNLLATIDSSKISPKYNATISSIKTTCNATTQTGSGTNLSLGKAVTGTNTMTTVVTDSRGYTLTVSTNFTALAYTPPSFSSLVINRCNSSGTTSTSGTYYAVTANVSYTTLASNTLTIQTHYKKLGASSYTSYVAISNNTKSVQGSGNITTTDSYVVEVRAYDTVVGTAGAVYQSRTIVNTSVAATFNLAPNGISAAFFGLADNSASKQLKVYGSIAAESLSLTTPLPIASGGTGAGSARAAATTLCVMPLGEVFTAIPVDSNIDDYYLPGTYKVSSNASAATMINLPVLNAGVLYVRSGVGGDISASSTYKYIVQEYMTYNGYLYTRKGDSGSSTSVTWGNWYRYITTSSLPLSVANGGTGATTPAAARTALGVVNYTSPTLLWTNSAIQDDFAAQKVTLSLSSYNFVLIEFATGPYNGNLQTMLVAKSMPSPPSGYADPRYSLFGMTRTGAACRMCTRDFTVSATGVTFDGGVWVENYGGTNTSNNNYCKPSRIWGIK